MTLAAWVWFAFVLLRCVAPCMPFGDSDAQKIWKEQIGRLVSTLNSFIKRASRNAGALSPFSNSQGFPLMRNSAVRALISMLLLAGCPSAICRFVIATTDDSVKGLPSGPLAHVGEKILESLPSIANGYAFSAIPAIRRIIGIFTSIQHLSPTRVCSRTLHSVGFLSTSCQGIA